MSAGRHAEPADKTANYRETMTAIGVPVQAPLTPPSLQTGASEQMQKSFQLCLSMYSYEWSQANHDNG